MSLPISEIMFWDRALHKYINIFAYIDIYEELFLKTQFTNLGWIFKTLFFFKWCLTHFGKELFIYIHIHVNAHLPINTLVRVS